MVARWLHRINLWELVRFYQAALLNTAFGYGCYALLIALGLNRYVAQVGAHAAGTAFNYLTYRRLVFRDARPAKARFVAAYALNYLVNLALLALFSRFIGNAYLAGLIATLAASVLNYLALKYQVFRPGAPA